MSQQRKTRLLPKVIMAVLLGAMIFPWPGAGLPNVQAEESDAITAVSWSPSGQMIAFGRANGIVEIFDVETEQTILILTGHSDAIVCFAWYPDESRLISNSDFRLLLWNLDTGELVADLNDQYGLPDGVFSIEWLAGGSEIILSPSGINESPQIWDASTFQKLSGIKYGPEMIHMAISPDGTKILASGVGGVFLMDSSSLEIGSGAVIGFGISTLAWSPDGQKIATSNWLGAIHLWDVSTGDIQLIRVIQDDVFPQDDFPFSTIRALQFSADGRALHSIGGDGIYTRWDTDTGDRLFSMQLSDGPLYGAEFSPDGTKLAYEGEGGALTVVELSS